MTPQLTTSESEHAAPTGATDPSSVASGSRAADRSAVQPRVLVIAHRTPFPPDKGDRIRTYNVLRYLAARARVDLATLADEPVTDEINRSLGAVADQIEIVRCESPLRWVRAALGAVAGRSATEGLFHSPDLHRRVRNMLAGNRYDLVVAVCSSMAPYVDRARAGRAKVVVDLIDVDSQKWLDYAATARGWRRWAYALEARRVRRIESALANTCDLIAVTTAAEAACYRAFQPQGRVAAIANGVDFEYFHPQPAAVEVPESCVFVGALDYKPNIDGMEWFCAAVWPAIRARRPAAQLRIVGRRPVDAIRRLAAMPGVELAADVPDVRPHLAQAQIVVAPLRIARGVQNKVLEALATGKAVIASPQSIEGLDVTPGVHLVQAGDDSQWLAALESLWDNESERRQLGASGRSFVVERHSWDSCLAPLGDLLAAASGKMTHRV